MFLLSVGSDGSDSQSVDDDAIVAGSPLLSSVAFDPQSSQQILKGSGESYTLGPDGVLMMTFGELLDKDIAELAFDVDGRGDVKVLLYDRQVQPMIVVSDVVLHPDTFIAFIGFFVYSAHSFFGHNFGTFTVLLA